MKSNTKDDEICRFRENKQTRECYIRRGTDQEEIIGIKREWIHPWRKTIESFNPAYYDVVVQELGKNIINYIQHLSR